MTDALLNALKLILLALIYLFFGRVLWAVWSEVRTPVMPAARVGGGTASRGRAKKSVGKGVPMFVVIEPKQHRGATYTLSSVLAIGRLEDNDIVLNDTNVSRKHAEFVCAAGEVMVHDLGSTNGTKVNGVVVHGEQLLQHGDVINFGTAQVTFEAS